MLYKDPNRFIWRFALSRELVITIRNLVIHFNGASQVNWGDFFNTYMLNWNHDTNINPNVRNDYFRQARNNFIYWVEGIPPGRDEEFRFLNQTANFLRQNPNSPGIYLLRTGDDPRGLFLYPWNNQMSINDFV